MSFHDLHNGPEALLLPDAWDFGSAAAFIEAGFAAVGTTSFGVGAAVGGRVANRETRQATTALIDVIRDMPAYITADIEDGYSDDPAEVADFVASLDVDGINIEDSTRGRLIDPELHAKKIAAIKQAAPDVFINARVDTFWLDQDRTVAQTIERSGQYASAGADGIFVPGLAATLVVAKLASMCPLPLNVLVIPDVSVDELFDYGVRRVSTGSLPYRAAIDAAVSVATSVKNRNDAPSATPYARAQAVLAKYSPQGRTA
ncbi:isocitrate lyase/phosphoenolpyruvate mutase family protein [Humibacter soli]